MTGSAVGRRCQCEHRERAPCHRSSRHSDPSSNTGSDLGQGKHVVSVLRVCYRVVHWFRHAGAEDRGIIAWDTRIRDVFTNYQTFNAAFYDATLDQLLAHRAGVQQGTTFASTHWSQAVLRPDGLEHHAPGTQMPEMDGMAGREKLSLDAVSAYHYEDLPLSHPLCRGGVVSLRSTEDGKAWQAMVDYHAGGNLMGIYGEGLGGKPHVRNYSFKEKITAMLDSMLSADLEMEVARSMIVRSLLLSDSGLACVLRLTSPNSDNDSAIDVSQIEEITANPGGPPQNGCNLLALSREL
jgi:hypothetical protein